VVKPERAGTSKHQEIPCCSPLRTGTLSILAAIRGGLDDGLAAWPEKSFPQKQKSPDKTGLQGFDAGGVDGELQTQPTGPLKSRHWQWLIKKTATRFATSWMILAKSFWDARPKQVNFLFFHSLTIASSQMASLV